MSTVEFWGGVGVIGSSKIIVTDGGHRVMLDFGMDVPAGADLFRAPVTVRPERHLAQRLRMGAAPRIGGVYDPALLDDGDPLAAEVMPTALFLTHGHIDHCGLAGFVRPEVPVHASPETVALLTALAEAGDGLPGGDPLWHPVAAETPVTVGPMTVERIDVDHDTPGASGYLVTTSDGVLAFTGDIRFHGRAPERSWHFADRAAGCDLLITEGTALGLGLPAGPPRNEDDVAGDFAAALTEAGQDLLLLGLYPRDLERVEEFLKIAGAAGRRIVWGDRVASFLRATGIEGVLSWSELGLAALRAEPGAFVYQPDMGTLSDIAELADLPIGPGTVWLHANGEPLGPFESRWQLFTEWLDGLGVPLRRIGSFGHATADDLHALVHRVAPKTVVPIHTQAPDLLHPTGTTTRLIPRFAQKYRMDGREA
ncbi:MBL fold hydrolase [Kitasatospora xanthocidica]|uniref:MBL fold metallo-hydrolase n=1 Tax=Kitasatospora xanthocidica TaxID=83382 RepID=UPI0016762C0C|nr:MBL fold metallo-hydrolase [Kitasatospora xanthocidica]GHF88707.1 MBL fold hydrolase [Kitasatospora xanthocidica]